MDKLVVAGEHPNQDATTEFCLLDEGGILHDEILLSISNQSETVDALIKIERFQWKRPASLSYMCK